MSRVSRLRSFMLTAVTMMATSFFAVPSHADNFMVNNTGDTADFTNCLASSSSGSCSLREAMAAAINTPGADSISFSPNVFETTRQTITLSGSQLPPVTGPLTISGPQNGVVISGNGASRIFQTSLGVSLTLSDLIITSGLTTTNGGAVLAQRATLTMNRCAVTASQSQAGGGIYALGGTVVLNGCTISGNSANRGAGIYFANDSGVPPTAASLVARNSTFHGNVALQRGGALHLENGVNTLQNCTITANQANTANGGGGIVVAGNQRETSLNNSIAVGNTNDDVFLTPGIFGSIKSGGHNLIGVNNVPNTFQNAGDTESVANAGLGALADNGGITQTCAPLPGSPAIDNGETTLTTDQIGNPRPRGLAADIGAFETEAALPDPTLIVTTDLDSNVSEDGLTSLREALATVNSRAITTSTTKSTITFDPTFFATHKTVTLSSELPVVNASVSIIGPAAGISLQMNAGVQYGFQFASGTIRLQRFWIFSANTSAISNQANLTVENCTLSSNVTGISNTSNGRLALDNSTVALNAVGIKVFQAVQAYIRNCTIAGNTTAGIIADNTGAPAANLYSSVVAGNGNNISGTLALQINNFIGTLQDSGLENFDSKPVLKENGGPTRTIALLPGSPAIDTASTPLLSDQRGYDRPSGAAPDMGAFEFQYQESFVVNTLVDENNGTSDPNYGTGTSLREAIAAANLNGPGLNEISFSSTLFATRQTLTLTSDLPTIATDIKISAPSAGLIIKATSGISQLRVTAGTVELTGLTFNGEGNTNALINNGGTVTVRNSAFARAQYYAISNIGASSNLTLQNCTLASSVNGGAVINESVLSVQNCTIAFNRTGLNNTPGGTVSLTNSIVANNFDSDISGSLAVDAYNLTFVTWQAGLYPDGLRDNGGQSDTISIWPDSLAINAGDPNFDSVAMPYDQRGQGFARKVGNTIDIGAFEFKGNSPVAFTQAAYPAYEHEGQATITVRRSGTGPVQVAYSTSAGTAVEGEDYLPASGTLFWTGDDLADKTFTIPIQNDGSGESDETVNLTLSNATFDGILGEPSTAVLTIHDGDFTPPSAEVTTPANGAVVANLTEIRALAEDNGSGVPRVDLYLARHTNAGATEYWAYGYNAEGSSGWNWRETQTAIPMAKDENGWYVKADYTPGFVLPNGALLPPGIYYPYITVFNGAGLMTTSDLNHSFVGGIGDTVAPSVTVLTPTEGSFIK